MTHGEKANGQKAKTYRQDTLAEFTASPSRGSGLRSKRMEGQAA
jgi:hypothetical protein